MSNPSKGKGSILLKEIENYDIYKKNKGRIYSTQDLMYLFNYKSKDPSQTTIIKYVRKIGRGKWLIKDDLVMISQGQLYDLGVISQTEAFWNVRFGGGKVFNLTGTCYSILIVKKEILPFWTLEEFGGWIG